MRCRTGASRSTVSRRQRVGTRQRSEEHTSELQSLTNLVCRLLLEKKKNRVERAYERSDASAGHGVDRSRELREQLRHTEVRTAERTAGGDGDYASLTSGWRHGAQR